MGDTISTVEGHHKHLRYYLHINVNRLEVIVTLSLRGNISSLTLGFFTQRFRSH